MAGAGAGGRGWQECAGHSRLRALPGDGSWKAKVRVGLNLVWKVDSKLTLSLPTMVPFRLVLSLDVRDASCYIWGEGGERDTDLPLDPPNTPCLLTQPFFSSYKGDHRTLGGTQHTTQNQRSPCRQGNTHWTKGAGTHPEEHANTEDPRRSKDATTRRALRKHNYLRKSHCWTT